MNENWSGLPNAIGSISGLVFNRRVPPAIKMDDVRRPREVQPCAAGLQRERKKEGPVLLKLCHQVLSLTNLRPSVEKQPLAPKDSSLNAMKEPE